MSLVVKTFFVSKSKNGQKQRKCLNCGINIDQDSFLLQMQKVQSVSSLNQKASINKETNSVTEISNGRFDSAKKYELQSMES